VHDESADRNDLSMTKNKSSGRVGGKQSATANFTGHPSSEDRVADRRIALTSGAKLQKQDWNLSNPFPVHQNEPVFIGRKWILIP
jgi:hypothetical protein